MRSISSLALTGPIVGPFTDRLIQIDLPRLHEDQRAAATDFATRRIAGMPGVVRTGVLAVALPVRIALGSPVAGSAVRFLARHPLPLVGEYVRLVRSLVFAFVWESWPDTRPDGGAA
ncbi:MAG: hypothetical protein AB7L17_00345 [Ilumatobacteraceae bacterium]|jgi:hypothetical protein